MMHNKAPSIVVGSNKMLLFILPRKLARETQECVSFGEDFALPLTVTDAVFGLFVNATGARYNRRTKLHHVNCTTHNSFPALRCMRAPTAPRRSRYIPTTTLAIRWARVFARDCPKLPIL